MLYREFTLLVAIIEKRSLMSPMEILFIWILHMLERSSGMHLVLISTSFLIR